MTHRQPAARLSASLLSFVGHLLRKASGLIRNHRTDHDRLGGHEASARGEATDKSLFNPNPPEAISRADAPQKPIARAGDARGYVPGQCHRAGLKIRLGSQNR